MTRQSPNAATRRGLILSSAAGALLPAMPATAQNYAGDWDDTLDTAAARKRWATHGARPDANGVMRLGLAVRYRTDPARIAPFLFPPLEVDPTGEVQINYFIILRPDGYASVGTPGATYGESDLMLSCLYQGKRCMTTLPWILNSDPGRYLGREGVMLRKKDGRIMLDVRDGVMHATTTRQGKTQLKISAPLTKEPAHPRFWFREVGWGEMRLDYRLNVNWKESLFDAGPIDLWQHFGADDGYPSDMGAAGDWPRYPRAIDLAATRIDLGDPSALDPYAEFPVMEILGGSASVGPELFPTLAVPRGPNKVLGRRQRNEPDERVKLGTVEKADVAPLAFIAKAFDPPIHRGKAWSPPGWPASGSVVRLPKDELDRWQAREAIEIGPATIVDLHMTLDPALHARAVPPPFTPGPNPALRIIAQKVDISDVSTAPFTDIWLLIACQHKGVALWHALSQLVSWDGDVINGREIFGYPAKLGEPDIHVGSDRIDVIGRRAKREIVSLRVETGMGALLNHADSLDVVGVQPQPRGRQPQALWIGNPWRLSMPGARKVAPTRIALSFPRAEGPGLVGLTDPWFEFDSARVIEAFAGRGIVQRLPGRILGPVSAAAGPYLSDRRDQGAWPIGKPNTSFLARK